MNKTKSLLIAALALSAQCATAYTNKTFLQPRNQALVNLPMEMTTFQERTGSKLEDRFGANFEIVGFYGQMTNKSDIGTYFGANTNNMNVVATGLVAGDVSDINTIDGTLDFGYIIHDAATASLTPVGNDDLANYATSITLNPKSSHYGVDFVYYQDLAKIVKGLYLKVNLPVEQVETNPKINVSQVTGYDGYATQANIYNYFAGQQITNIAENMQDPLNAAKITGKHTATGVADIDILVGYNFVKQEKYFFGLNLGLSIPTGREATGEFMFEPIYGTKNFGFGGGMEAEARLWGSENHNVKINAKANYRYMFKASGVRTLGLGDNQWGQYLLLASSANPTVAPSATNPTILTPAANILTKNCDITLGSQLDGIIGFAYNNGGFNVDLGYNLYYRDAEKVRAKSPIDANTYVIAARSLNILNNQVTGVSHTGNANVPFATNANVADDTAVIVAPTATPKYLTQDDVNTDAAATPSQFTNGIYAGVGYACKEWKYPLMVGIGGKYEFAAKNSVEEVWQVWAKIGVSF
jgi:hypothetical protein